MPTTYISSRNESRLKNAQESNRLSQLATLRCTAWVHKKAGRNTIRPASIRK